MHNQLAIASLTTPLGELGLVAGEHGLIRVSFGANLSKSLNGLLARRRDRGNGRCRPWEVLEQACTELGEYLCSAREKFDTPLDFSSGTEFQRAVWRRLRRVKYGEIVSYARLAASAGKPRAIRAVGNAVGANPLPIFVPCHRVIASNGGIGGFSGGLRTKRKLLSVEGFEVFQ